MRGDLWTYLQSAGLPIVLYGMGNGADKLIAQLSARGLEAADFFASDGFVRGHSFHGKTVLTFDEILAKYEDFIVLLSFGSSLPELLERFETLSRRCRFFVPELPIAGDTLFTASYYESVRDKLERVRTLLADDRSREVFDGIVEYRLTGRIDTLLSTCDDREEVFRILRPERYEAYLDLGAYNGDTIRELLTYQPDLHRIWALEPDRRSFRKLMESAERDGFAAILTAEQAGAWECDGMLYVSDEGSRNSHLNGAPEGKSKPVEVRSPDSLLRDERVDYIKYDVEGAEREALLGSVQTIARWKPDLAVSLYHRAEDLWRLPLMVHEIDPSYRLYLRRPPYIPPWDLCLYAISES
ncbi:MAG: FkbM family methyltransferase [Clostridia bacterium]|nr:FkbM family methyltransferase [Clostridia bacterium]